MKKFLTFAVTFAFTLALLFVLPSCGKAEKAAAPDFTVLDSDEVLDVKKVSLESLCDLSDMTFERIFGDDDDYEEIKRYYTADDMRFINCFIVVTEDGIYRTFSTASSTLRPREVSLAKTYIEFYEPKYKITDLTLGSDVKIERAYRNTASYHDPFILGGRAFAHEALSQPKENCANAYIYDFDAGEDARSTYEYFDISNGYPTPKSEEELKDDVSATAFIYYMWQVRGTGKQIFDFAAESTAESE